MTIHQLPKRNSSLEPVGEPIEVLYYTFRCTLCEQKSEWRDGYPQTADEVKIAWVDADGTSHVRTMFEEDRCFICRECMAKCTNSGEINCTDARGAKVYAHLKMYN